MREVPAWLKLARFRALHGVSLREAARLLGVSAPTVLDWERARKRPSLASRRAICIWTHGQIAEHEWASAEERARDARLEQIQPFEPARARRSRVRRASRLR